ncbi:hypothetical protein SNEBB_002942 [Seison nebaliae]|nr:hypothetical protein SNEBB_002942 [Seison nebaliae]
MEYDIKDGNYTSTIYTLIKNKKFGDAIRILNIQLEYQPNNKAALSLLGYSYYQQEDYVNASDCYEQLHQLSPDQRIYKLYYSQCLYKCGFYDEAYRIAATIENDDEFQLSISKLQSAIKYAQNDITAVYRHLQQLNPDDDDVSVDLGCVLFKEEKYEEALEKFIHASKMLGFKPALLYNISLCYCKLENYKDALSNLGELIARSTTDHPELNVGMMTAGLDVASVGNSLALHESALVEAFNLKAYIEYKLKNSDGAKEALMDMPPRQEHELDPVTLHNIAVTYIDEDGQRALDKLHFLLEQDFFPKETYANVVFLYLKYEMYDEAADFLASTVDVSAKYLTPNQRHFIDAVTTRQISYQDSYKKLEQMLLSEGETLRRLLNELQVARNSGKVDIADIANKKYMESCSRYLPILMAQGKIYWDRKNYTAVEKIFRRSMELCHENEVWRQNVAHVIFVQEDRYMEAISFYEPIAKTHEGDLLELPAILLTNLCICYILIGQNQAAEDLLKLVEEQEDVIFNNNPNKKLFHFCIMNLGIGTLYCSRGNYEFGISRVIKSLQPFDKKLGYDTWFYAKKCFLALFLAMSLHVVTVRDTILSDIMNFLMNCEEYGRGVVAFLPNMLKDGQTRHRGQNNVSYESRCLQQCLCVLIRQA